MGSVHNELRASSLQQGIREAVGGDMEMAIERLGETLTPVIDPWRLPEWANLRGEFLWGFFLNQPAVVGEVSAIGVLNPFGSNKLEVIDRISWRTGAGSSASIGFATSALLLATLTSAQSLICRDLRSAPQSATGLVVFGSDPALVNILTVVMENDQWGSGPNIVANSTPIVLPPGWGYAVVANTANTSLAANFYGRERTSFATER